MFRNIDDRGKTKKQGEKILTEIVAWLQRSQLVLKSSHMTTKELNNFNCRLKHFHQKSNVNLTKEFKKCIGATPWKSNRFVNKILRPFEMSLLKWQACCHKGLKTRARQLKIYFLDKSFKIISILPDLSTCQLQPIKYFPLS